MTILIIGDAWGDEEARQRSAFVGPAGRFLRAHLRAVGIDPHECRYTNVFNLRPTPTLDVKNLCGDKRGGIKGIPAIGQSAYIRAEFQPEIDRLYEEIHRINPNVILALGPTPTTVLTRQPSRIASGRGTIIVSPHTARADGTPYKILPTYHPSTIIREYALRPVWLKDLEKAARHAASPEYHRPQRELWLEPTLPDLDRFANTILEPRINLAWGVDIETAHGTITEIGFARPDVGIVIPFYKRAAVDGNYWPNADTEAAAWARIDRWLHRMTLPVFQNGLYDINYLWRTMGIQVWHAGEDTMLMHHAMQPEMKKGLGFLGSVYTDEPLWKSMRKDQQTLKKEDD
jgi:uracil-DNA glycosylase